MVGIYKITNTIDGKCYIGQSTDLEKRIKRHIKTLLNGTNRNEHLQNAYNKYGTGNFTIEIIEECSIEELDEKEIYWIDFYKSYDRNYGYNKTKGGTGGNGYFECYNDEEKEEIRTKKSKNVSGKLNPNFGAHCYTDGIIIKYIKDDEIKKYKSNGWYPGVPEFVRNKEKLSNLGEKNGFYGKSHSEETKQKLSQLRSGELNWNFGKVIYHKDNEQKYIALDEVEYYESLGWIKGLTEEIKKKISENNTGRKMSEDVLRKKSYIYVYNDKEFIGWRSLQKYLRENGYPKISEAAIVKLSEGKDVKGYDNLKGKIECRRCNYEY